MMPQHEYEALCDDIRAHGLSDPELTTYEGKILDGRHRYRACKELSIAPTFKAFEGSVDEAMAFVISRNLDRRHLNESQRSMIAARVANLPRGANQHTAIAASSQSRVGELFRVSPDSIQRARVVLEHGTRELIKAVDDGVIAVSVAADLVDLPADEQRRVVIAAATNRFAATNAAREVKRNEQIGALIVAGTPSLDGLGRFAVILADPPWRYEHPMSNRDAIENNYPTMSVDEICELPVADLALDDCVFFLWSTSSMLAQACRVIDAWGFDYRTCAAWDKLTIGRGYYFRQQHELLLLAIRGNPPAPPPSARVSSIIRARRMRHSAKPEIVYAMIDAMYPKLPKLELFARGVERLNWVSWGNEVSRADDEIREVGAK